MAILGGCVIVEGGRMARIDSDDAARLLAVMRDEGEAIIGPKQCVYCGGMHLRACPRVKRIAYHPDGQIREVRFFESFSDSHVIWPEDLQDAVDEIDDQSSEASAQ